MANPRTKASGQRLSAVQKTHYSRNSQLISQLDEEIFFLRAELQRLQLQQEITLESTKNLATETIRAASDHTARQLNVTAVILTLMSLTAAGFGFFSFKNIDKVEQDIINSSKEIRAIHKNILDMEQSAKTGVKAITEYQRNTAQLMEKNDVPLLVNSEEAARQQQLAGSIIASPESEPVFYAAGIEAYGKKQYESALIFFESYFVINPNNAAALLLAGVSATKLVDTTENKTEKKLRMHQAENYFRRATDIKSDYYEAWSWWGWLLWRYGRTETDMIIKRSIWDNAGEKFQRVVKINTDDENTWYSWGWLLWDYADIETDFSTKRRLWNSADEKFQQALRIKPDNVSAWYQWGWQLWQQVGAESSLDAKRRLMDAAEEKFRKVIQLNSDHKDALTLLKKIERLREPLKKR